MSLAQLVFRTTIATSSYGYGYNYGYDFDFDFFFRSAHRCFIISEIRLREAALMWRRGRLVPA